MREITAAIPAHNAARFLKDAIGSVFSQGVPCSDIIVIDDGSTDETRDIASSFGQVRYIFQKRGGDAAARNRAIDEARGEFIAFLDADDVWLPEKLEEQMILFEQDPTLGMVYSGVHVVDEDLRHKDVLRAADPTVALRNTLLLEKPYMTGIGSTAVLPIHVARQIRFDERLRASADWAFACHVALTHRVGSIEHPLALYRQHGGPQVHHNLPAIEWDMHLIWGEVFADGLVPPPLMRYRRRAAANLDLSLAASSHKSGDYANFMRYLLRALIRRPDRVASAFWRRYTGDIS